MPGYTRGHVCSIERSTARQAMHTSLGVNRSDSARRPLPPVERHFAIGGSFLLNRPKLRVGLETMIP